MSKGNKTIVLAGAFDTKGAEYQFVKQLIEATGSQTLTIDFGVMGTAFFAPDIDRTAVATAAGAELTSLADGNHKDEAMRAMGLGLAKIVAELYTTGKLDGILAMGGSGGTSIATTAMRVLPVGVPKVMVSTIPGGNIAPYAGDKDIVFMPSVVDVSGINRISRDIYTNAAGAIVGMVDMEKRQGDDKPLIVASMFGNTTPCITRAREALESKGYEVLVFHATGNGGRTMESLIADGYISASLDITTTELADEVCGGALSAGPERMLAAARQGIPTVLSVGCIDMANFHGRVGVPAHYQQRKIYEWNPQVALMRTNVEENQRIGEMIAAAANASSGPVAILLPLKGVSMLDSEGQPFWDPAADAACFEAIKRNVKPTVHVIEMENNVNDPAFADKAVELLLELYARKS
ncbi:MAG: Tm-1-like ATP-binding domain-containing protein [Caldilineaceae bacterium]